jgi:hypothetical protein
MKTSYKAKAATQSQSACTSPASHLIPVDKTAVTCKSPKTNATIIEAEDGIDSPEESSPFEFVFPVTADDWQIPTNTPAAVTSEIAGKAMRNRHPDDVRNAALQELWNEALCYAAKEVAALYFGHRAKTEIYLEREFDGIDYYEVRGHFRLMYPQPEFNDWLCIEKVGQIARQIQLPEGTLFADPNFHRDYDGDEGSEDYVSNALYELEVAINAIRALHDCRERVVERARKLIAQFWAETQKPHKAAVATAN